jgi:putative hemolysin
MVMGQIFVLMVLILLSAIFSGIETALMSLNSVKVNALLKQEKKGSKALYRIKQNPSRLIITILIGNNLINIGAASFATVVFTELFGSSGIGIATGVMTFFILVFGEITPKTFAAQNAEKVSLVVAKPVELFSILLTPFVWVFEKIAKFMTWILGSKGDENISEEELKAIVTMGRDQGILNKEAAEMMHNVLQFKGTKVTSVMTPKLNVEMLDANKKLKDVFDFVVKSPFSRYPVYEGDENNIVGVLDVDEILKYVRDNKMNSKLKTICKKPFFVPESKEIDDLLSDLENKKITLAFVVDEYGSFLGLVSVEDILEEIVGDIFDKSKRESVHIKKIKKDLVRINAQISVEEINKTLHLGIKEGDFDTLAGFIEHSLQRIPKKGEKIHLKKITLEIDKVTDREIKSVKIIKK